MTNVKVIIVSAIHKINNIRIIILEYVKIGQKRGAMIIKEIKVLNIELQKNVLYLMKMKWVLNLIKTVY